MTCAEAIEHLSNLRLLKTVYQRLLKDKHKTLYRNEELKKLIKMTSEEMTTLTERMVNMELLDSYDQNTGVINKIYRERTEEDNLLKLCGGPRDEQ